MILKCRPVNSPSSQFSRLTTAAVVPKHFIKCRSCLRRDHRPRRRLEHAAPLARVQHLSAPHLERPTSIPPDVTGRGWSLGLRLVAVAAAALAPEYFANQLVNVAQRDLPLLADGAVGTDFDAVVVDAAVDDVAVAVVDAADVAEAQLELESSSVAQASEAGLAPNTFVVPPAPPHFSPSSVGEASCDAGHHIFGTCPSTCNLQQYEFC